MSAPPAIGRAGEPRRRGPPASSRARPARRREHVPSSSRRRRGAARSNASAGRRVRAGTRRGRVAQRRAPASLSSSSSARRPRALPEPRAFRARRLALDVADRAAHVGRSARAGFCVCRRVARAATPPTRTRRRTHVHGDRRSRILPVELAELPLAAEQPDGIVDARLEPGRGSPETDCGSSRVHAGGCRDRDRLDQIRRRATLGRPSLNSVTRAVLHVGNERGELTASWRRSGIERGSPCSDQLCSYSAGRCARSPVVRSSVTPRTFASSKVSTAYREASGRPSRAVGRDGEQNRLRRRADAAAAFTASPETRRSLFDVTSPSWRFARCGTRSTH